MCLYPTLIKNPKYKKTKKNGGNIPPITDQRVTYVPIGCQNCIECRKQKARQWQVRLLEDIKTNKNGKFICLTFSNEWIKKFIHGYENENGHWIDGIDKNLEGYAIDNAIATMATRLFLERWRKEHKKSLRHWLVTELGHKGTEHIHIHGIIWTDEPLAKVERIWKHGYVWKGKETRMGNIINYVSERTVNYMVKYMIKIDIQHKSYKQIILTSPGIGANYKKTWNAKLNKYNGIQTEERYRTRTGHQIAMPIYWRNQIYTEKEREQLWLQKLDKEERWVCGEKVSIKKDDKQYWKLVEYHRKKSKRLGYTEKPGWEQQLYEQATRNIKILTRIKNATTIKPRTKLESDPKKRTHRKQAKAINKVANTKDKTSKSRATQLRRENRNQ